jgi:ribosomal protein L40E
VKQVFACIDCGARYPLDERAYVCAKCGGKGLIPQPDTACRLCLGTKRLLGSEQVKVEGKTFLGRYFALLDQLRGEIAHLVGRDAPAHAQDDMLAIQGGRWHGRFGYGTRHGS